MPENLSGNFLEEQEGAVKRDLDSRIDGLLKQFQGFTPESKEQTIPNASEDSFYMLNIAAQVPAGMHAALRNTVHAAEDLAGFLDDNLFGDLVSTDRIFDLPDPDDIWGVPAGTAAGFTRGATQFLIGFLPVLGQVRALTTGRRLVQLARITKTGKIGARFAQATIAGAVTDFTVWGPHQPKMSNLINENIPMLANPITEYLASDPDDSAIEGRLKNAIEGAFLGAAAEGIFKAIRLLKATNTARAALEGTESGATGGARGVAGEGAERLARKSIKELSDEFVIKRQKLARATKGAIKNRKPGGPSEGVIRTEGEFAQRELRKSFEASLKEHPLELLEIKEGFIRERLRNAGGIYGKAKEIIVTTNRELTGDELNAFINQVKEGLPKAVRGFRKDATGISTFIKQEILPDGSAQIIFDLNAASKIAKKAGKKIDFNKALVDALKPLVRAGAKEIQVTQTVGRALKKAPKDVKVDFVTEDAVYFSSKKTGQRYIEFKGKEGVFRIKPGAVTRKGVSGVAPTDVPPKARTVPASTKGLVKESPASSKGEGIVVGDRKLLVNYDNIREGDAAIGDITTVVRAWQKVQRGLKDPQTLAQIEAKAQKLGFVLEDIREGFTGTADEWSSWLRAVIKTRDEAIIDFIKLGERAEAGDIAARAVYLKRFAMTNAIELYSQGKFSDAGRTLWTTRTGESGKVILWRQIAEGVDNAISTGLDLDEVIKRTNRLARETDAEQVANFTKQIVRPGAWELFMEMWINGILSGVRTLFAVNPIGNISTTATAPIERFLAGVLKPMGRAAPKGAKTTITTASGETKRVFLGVQKGEAWAMVMSWGDDLVTLKRGAGKLLTGGDRTFAEMQRQEGIIKTWTQGVIDLGRLMKKGFNAESRLGEKGTKLNLPAVSRENINAQNLKIILSEDFGLGKIGVTPRVNAEALWARSIDFIGKTIRLPGKILVATDDIFKGIVERMEIHAEAWRQATMEGYLGKAFSKRFDELLLDVDLIQGAAKRAKAAGELRTFTNELDGWGKSIQSFANSHPSARLIVPFVRTPINIGTYSLKRTPVLNLAWKETRNAVLYGGSGLEADLVRGQFALGVTVATGVAALAADGVITGTGPRSSIERKIMRDAGWQPLSVNIGGTYYSFNRFDPWAISVGIVADVVHMVGKVPNKTVDEVAMAVALAMSRNFTSKTYLQGMANFFEIISDPPRAGRDLRRLGASFMPFSSLQRQIGTIIDPTLRETRSLIDEIYNTTVGLSDKLPPSRNLKGEAIMLPPGVGPFGIIPLYVSNDSQDPVWMEMMRNQARFGMPSQTLFGTPQPLIALEPARAGQGVLLTPFEYDEYVRLAGNELKINGKGMWEELEWLIDQEFYDNATDGPDGGKVAFMSRIVRRYRDAARDEMVRRFPRLEEEREDLLRSRAEVLGKGTSSISSLGSVSF